MLWELGSASVRQVRERLCPNEELAFNTVQTFLRIMDDKGLVSHKSQGRSFDLYSPLQPRTVPLRVSSSKYSTVRWTK